MHYLFIGLQIVIKFSNWTILVDIGKQELSTKLSFISCGHEIHFKTLCDPFLRIHYLLG